MSETKPTHKQKLQTDFLQDDSDVLVFGVNPKSGTSLQDAFLKYKTERQVSVDVYFQFPVAVMASCKHGCVTRARIH